MSPSSDAPLPSHESLSQGDEVRSFLSRVRRRWFAQTLLTTVARAAFGASLPGLAGLAIAWLFAPVGLTLVLLAAVTLAASVGTAAFAVWHMQRRPDDGHVARFVEERARTIPGMAPLDDALVSAVDGSGEGTALEPLVMRAATRRLAELSPSQIVEPSAIRRAAGAAAAGVVLLIGTLVLARVPLGRSLQTAWFALYPGAIQIAVQPGDTRVLGGQPLAIRAVIHDGAGHTLTHLPATLTVTAGTQQRRVPMTAEGGAFVFGFESVDRTFKYRVTAGAAASSEYTVNALFAPRVERIDLQYEYPAFTGLRTRLEQNGGDIYAPAGTKVRLRIYADRPVPAGEMALGGGQAKALQRIENGTLEAEIVLARDDSYRIRLTDENGLAASGDTEYFIRLMDDRPPDVRILRPAGDQQITPLEEVVIEARAEDDYGIGSFELVYAVPGGQARVVPFAKITGTDSAKLGAHVLAAEDLSVKPGDVITYYARARDVARGKRSTETRSDMYFLEVRPFSEEFVEARSQAGSGPSGAQLEALIAAQKEIINATWNIERRSEGGRSVADLKAVADAQAELKARAEQMGMRRGRARGLEPIRAPQQVAPGIQPGLRAGSGDPVGEAAEAMGRAVEHLQGQRTGDALPHEMAALQALLRAQAEIRRREVMRHQASGGGGGSGRQGEDLSALFDKELQRQQRTNYENRSQLEERPDQGNRDDLLDRIRDLARRQEDVSRRQRELAESQASEEERKRQLERLTREQTELREQLEKLAAEAGQSGRGESSRGESSRQQGGRSQTQTGQGSSASRGMQDASEQMRSAAGSLQQKDAAAAAKQGAQAADQLRSIEQQLRGGSPEARERAARELQLEAQQIADEQRRISGEAARLEKGAGAATADADAGARERLAREKERLAGRADSLQRGVGELAKQEARAKPGRDTDIRAGEAATTLEREEIGRRMRDGARQLRDAAVRPANAAADEEQLARSLDRVADLLGGASGETRDLSAQLEETRQVRQRLDRLEAQIREAEAKRQGRADARGARGQQGESGSASAAGDKELERLREEYAKELQRASELLGRLQQSAPRSGLGGRTPEQYERSQSDPGNQPFKQDHSRWESLRKDVNLALERTDAAVSARLAEARARDRLSSGGSDRAPDGYRTRISRYYESLARSKK